MDFIYLWFLCDSQNRKWIDVSQIIECKTELPFRVDMDLSRHWLKLFEKAAKWKWQLLWELGAFWHRNELGKLIVIFVFRAQQWFREMLCSLLFFSMAWMTRAIGIKGRGIFPPDLQIAILPSRFASNSKHACTHIGWDSKTWVRYCKWAFVCSERHVYTEITVARMSLLCKYVFVALPSFIIRLKWNIPG